MISVALCLDFMKLEKSRNYFLMDSYPKELIEKQIKKKTISKKCVNTNVNEDRVIEAKYVTAFRRTF